MWEWRCLICEREMSVVPGMDSDDDSGTWPCINGGTIRINFGYGSKFDNSIMENACIEHQACICDTCYEKRIQSGLVRAVRIMHNTKWEQLKGNYRTDMSI